MTGISFIWLAAALLMLPLPWCFGALFAALIHELGHMGAVKAFGGRITGFSLSPGGAVLRAEGLTPVQSILCSLAGPMAGLLPLLFLRLVPRTAVCGLCYYVFNLLPLAGLDGGNVLKGILELKWGSRGARGYQTLDLLTRSFLILAGSWFFVKLEWGIVPLVTAAVISLRGTKIKIPCQNGPQAVQ